MYRGRVGYADLIRAGLVREAGVVQSIVCHDCEDPHDAAVNFAGGRYGYYCPDLGFVALERDGIVGVEPDIGKLVDALANAFECKRRNSKPIHGATWRVGVVETDQGGVAIYLHPRIQDGSDLHHLEAALGREVGSAFSVVLTACGSLIAAESKTLKLADVVDLDPAASALVAITDVPAIAGVRRVLVGGAPNQFGADVKSIIAERSRNGRKLPGTNEEARAIIEVFSARHPAQEAPSLPTVKRYMNKAETGS